MRIIRSSLLIIASSLFSLPLAAPEPGYTVYGGAPRYEMMTTKFIPKDEPIVAAPIAPVVEEPKGRWVWATVTAYSPHVRSCGKWSRLGLTSTGVQVRSADPDNAYGIAADPKVIPYGTSIYVPGYWEKLQNNANFIPSEMTSVDDTGGGMRQSTRRGVIHIDIRFRSQSEAVKWGTKRMKIFIYD
jgi:3D (Asp-Asp-Asp) domain-containing protein